MLSVLGMGDVRDHKKLTLFCLNLFSVRALLAHRVGDGVPSMWDNDTTQIVGLQLHIGVPGVHMHSPRKGHARQNTRPILFGFAVLPVNPGQELIP